MIDFSEKTELQAVNMKGNTQTGKIFKYIFITVNFANKKGVRIYSCLRLIKQRSKRSNENSFTQSNMGLEICLLCKNKINPMYDLFIFIKF